jgi:hypothetical protein
MRIDCIDVEDSECESDGGRYRGGCSRGRWCYCNSNGESGKNRSAKSRGPTYVP